MDLRDHIRTIPDFPKPGILFRDVTTLFAHGPAFAYAVERLAERLAAHRPTAVAGVEARGFLLAGALAPRLGVGALLVRKKGKLPWRTVSAAYALEYGEAEIELHEDAAGPGDRVVVLDDLVATGGTALAAIALLRGLGAVPVAVGAVIDLPDLGGGARIRAEGVPVETLVSFDGH